MCESPKGTVIRERRAAARQSELVKPKRLGEMDLGVAETPAEEG